MKTNFINAYIYILIICMIIELIASSMVWKNFDSWQELMKVGSTIIFILTILV
jgi:hypothetical protein